MTIPDYQTIMLPLLKIAGDKKEHSIREAIDYIADLFKLSEEQKKEVLPSGRSYIIDNRVGWARTYLKKSRTNRGHTEVSLSNYRGRFGSIRKVADRNKY